MADMVPFKPQNKTGDHIHYHVNVWNHPENNTFSRKTIFLSTKEGAKMNRKYSQGITMVWNNVFLLEIIFLCLYIFIKVSSICSNYKLCSITAQMVLRYLGLTSFGAVGLCPVVGRNLLQSSVVHRVWHSNVK